MQHGESKFMAIKRFFQSPLNEKHYLNMMAKERTLIGRIKITAPMQTRFGRVPVHKSKRVPCST